MSFRRLFSALALFLFCLTVCAQARAQADKRERAAAEIESLREQLKAKEAVLLALSKEDQETYAAFLSRPDTGLARLLPREKWDGKLTIRGGGGYYSFTRRSNDYDAGPDIELAQGLFMAGFAGADFGFMTALGDVPLETVSTETEAVQFMASFKPPSVEAEARKAAWQFAPAHEEGRWTYTRAQQASVNNTYVLRSINYGESDVLVAFRVVRKDADGSVVLLWKMIEKFPAPELKAAGAAAGQ